MTAAVPAGVSLEKVVHLEMSEGDFPSSGAVLTFTVDQPVPADNIPFISHWDTQNLMWVPLPSNTSPDRTTVSAKLEHFSTYGLFDLASNTIGKFVGVRTAAPECQNPPPDWDDKSAPQFYDDINGPVLWCAGTNPDHPDDLEIKLKLNRGAAASITTSVKPVGTYSDLWKELTPETWATMVLSGPDALIPNPDTYFIQPTGEYHFRFTKSDMLNFWHSNRTEPLIEVNAAVPYILAGLLYNRISDSSVFPALSLVTTKMALAQCASEIYGTGTDLSLTNLNYKTIALKLPAMMGAFASCLSDQKESVAKATAKYWATRDPASTITDIEKKADFAAKGILFAARIYAAVQVLAPVADALTDLLLDPITRQFVFFPSDQALKDLVRRPAQPDVGSRPAQPDVGSVNAPPMCTRPGGRLVDGELPIPKIPGELGPGSTVLKKNSDGSYLHAVGDSSTKTEGLTALVFQCSIGGVAWPETVAVYSNYGGRLDLLAWSNLSDIDHKEHSDVDAISFEDEALRVHWRTNADGEPGACVTVHKTARLSTKPIPDAVPSVSLTPEDVRVVSKDRCMASGR